ncbi:MAG TPA: proline racemase family protein [Acidobacteriaceae bacterium]|jgi:4-hydroxyproline epimerase|nr:proline racemase family protein [Acidobacteriaceae bacterium]
MSALELIEVVDSHTEGEPTRLVIAGGPDLGGGSLAERLARMAREHDGVRSAVVNEPRGSDVVVGALLAEPEDRACAAGVIFFNNVGYLGMCGHGTIGVVATLEHLGRIDPGEHRIETPVGVVRATLHGGGRVTVENVASYRHRKDVVVEVPGFGRVRGEVAWGGNWFFLTEGAPVELKVGNRDALTEYTWAIRQALGAQGITGKDGEEVDHVEVFAESGAGSRNFVMCPGKAYDRSPCGTGTSAKLACLAADGKLKPGAVWRQEGILGTVFEGSYRLGEAGTVIPSITGRAFITAESRLLLDRDDPFRAGIPF